MKKRTKIIIIILAVVAVLIGVIVYISIGELREEDILKQEVVNFSNKDLLNDDFSIEVKTTGDRAYIEEAVKKYYLELSNNIKVIDSYLTNNIELQNVLTLESLINNRPTYEESLKIVSEAKNEVSKALNNIIKLCDEDTIKNLIDKKKLDDPDYYYDFYMQLMGTDKDLEKLKEVKENMETLTSDLEEFLDKVTEILYFLESNDSLITYSDTISFANDDLLLRYQTLVNELSEIANRMNSYSNNI